MKRSRCTFVGGNGEQLAARLDMPDGEPVAWALFAHCFTCSKDLRAVGAMTTALAARGIATLRFDFTGLGESEGDFGATTFLSNAADLVAAATYMQHELQAPSILVGHSLGGAGVLQAAADIPSVQAVATIGAPSSPAHVLALLGTDLEAIERDGSAQVALAGRPFRITREFVDVLRGCDMAATIAQLGRALAVFHSPVDEVVEIDNAAEIFAAARHPKSFVSLDHADHLLTDPKDSTYVGEVIAAWAHRYVVDRSSVAPGTSAAKAEV